MNRHLQRFGQSGFSLLEVLITVVIIAVGLMGFAGMMVKSAKNNRIAMHRSLATLYAYDIIDCMRVNRTIAIGGDYARDFEDIIPTGTTVAEDDVAKWLNSLSAVLPSGAGKITFSGNTVKVEIRWTETVGTDDSASHTWKTESTL